MVRIGPNGPDFNLSHYPRLSSLVLIDISCGSLFFCFQLLHRHRAIDRDAMHQSALRQVIIFDRQMLRTAIVPHE